ncbi:hypothetical protein RhiJN_19060 [Ceratobasidium sp. AG-Ba]|nr:hypothetical protein RhiJN_04240 [Ceratobasidium sp. AG-Ba]QRV91042.1 hypothetical protein RhiJN_19060 [Ceratobasidium sp. AG-Ba]QRW05133.1 hypothetical protein RhiLY_04132 [Ceratobasidium sp. AG-Ba]
MNTIPFTTSQSDAIRYLADVAAAQERTDAAGAPRSSAHPHRSYIPARRRRRSHKSVRVAGPPAISAGVPADIRELVQKVLETQKAKSRAEQGSLSPVEPAPAEPSSSARTPKPSLKLVPWTYPPIDEDAIAPPSPILVEASRILFPLEDTSADSSAYDSEFDTELETETETELETEVESDVAIHRPRVRVVDDSEPPTPEFEVESYKMEPLVIPTKSSPALIPVHPELTPVARHPTVEIRGPFVSEPAPKDPFGLGKLVDSTWVEDEDEDDEWISGPPSYYTSPPESPSATPACSPCATPMFTDDEYESEIEVPDFPFDPTTDPITTHHLRSDLEIIRPFSPLAPEITVTPPTWEAFFECMPQQDEAYGQLLALPGTTPLGPAELEHNTLVHRARIRRNPVTGSQECMWRGKWAPCCWACGGAAEGMDTSLPASQRTGWFVLDNQRWLMACVCWAFLVVVLSAGLPGPGSLSMGDYQLLKRRWL